MTDSPIRFPGLFGDWAFTASGVAFHIGGKAIYWYGIIIALGVVLALWFCMTQREKYGITEADFISAELCAVPAFRAVDIGFDRSLIGAYGHDDRVCAYPILMAEIDEKSP